MFRYPQLPRISFRQRPAANHALTHSPCLHGDPLAIIQLGVLLLIATPVARVAFLVVAFALERDQCTSSSARQVLVILLSFSSLV